MTLGILGRALPHNYKLLCDSETESNLFGHTTKLARMLLEKSARNLTGHAKMLINPATLDSASIGGGGRSGPAFESARKSGHIRKADEIADFGNWNGPVL
jgi:hypothetical protein